MKAVNTATQIMVGMGATELCYSDSYAYTIVKVSPSGKTIIMQQDTATLLNGFDSGEPDALVMYPGGFTGHVEGQQRYDYARNLQGLRRKATLRKDGKYGMVGSSRSNVRIGIRAEHYDYNF